MYKPVCLLLFILFCRTGDAQNLVPNPGFDQFSICPVGFGEIPKATGWSIPLFSTTPDYFNACSVNLNVDVPQNLCGYESARSGDAYAAIVTFHIQQQSTYQRNYREYLQSELTDSLMAGVEYCVSWYVSPCDSCNYVSNNIGMYFSSVQISDTCTPNPCNLNYLPQVENPSTNNLSNRNGWTPVTGTYTATGGEKYIIIGNFSDTTGSTGTFTGWGLQSGSDLNYIALYFIDDVLVAPCDSLTGISENSPEFEVSIFPNPFSDNLQINVQSNEPVEFTLFDMTSRIIHNHYFTNSTSINTGNYAKGMYFYEVKNKTGWIKKGKVVKD
jgi:OOP family OmpA-OmpF porin